MTHSELAKCKNLHLAVGVRYIVDMSRFAARFPWWWPGVAIAALAVAALSFVVARDIALGSARQDASAAARLQAALLDSEIARFRLLPLALADDRDITRAVAGDVAVLPALDRKLEALARATGAAAIYVVGIGGEAIAASNYRSPQSFVGASYRFRRYVQDALRSGSGSQFAIGTVSRQPGLYLSRRTSGGGVIVVKLVFDRLEATWRAARGISFVTDAAGVVLVSSRPAWRFASTRPLDPHQSARSRADALRGDAPMQILPLRRDDLVWRVGQRPYLASTLPVRQPGWPLTLLFPAGEALAWGPIAAGSAAAFLLALAVLAWMWRERAASRARRTAELEAAVEQRTHALSREMEERSASEARAAELREVLRQANRLATLGQVTAGVAHETAQPVAAIRTYAQTSKMLLERGDLATVDDNLGAIARLADRIGSVTTELRGFARRKPGDLRPVSLAEVIDGAMLILRHQLRTVTLDRAAIDPALRVMGGRVRLEQVVVNLLQNAVEALATTPDPRIALTIMAEPASVRLLVTDNGPGIAPAVAARLFTPFVTSRPDGLGLGLVIAHDIAEQMGGGLRLVPSPRGASFELRLPRA